MESCFVVVDGIRIHCWKAGSGPALVMVHGLVADGRNWELNVPALAGLRTVYAIDMMNMGLTARVANAKAGLRETADWLARWMDALGNRTADLVGSSHGGAVCLMFAARHPRRVRSMVLFDPANPYSRQAELPVRFWNSAVGLVAARMLPFLPHFATEFAHKRVYGDPARARECTLTGYRAGLNRTSIAHLRRITRSWWVDMAELERVLPEVTTPTLLVWGELDSIVGVESGKSLQKALGAELLVMPGVGHLPFVENVEEANQTMVRWLNR